MMQIREEHMTVKQAAASLGVTTNAVLGALHLGTLTGRKIDGRWSIDEEAVEEYRQNHRGRQGQLPKEKAVERARLAANTAAENRRKNRDVKVEEATNAIWERFSSKLSNHMSADDRSSLVTFLSQPQSTATLDQCMESITRLQRRVDALERKLKEAATVVLA